MDLSKLSLLRGRCHQSGENHAFMKQNHHPHANAFMSSRCVCFLQPHSHDKPDRGLRQQQSTGQGLWVSRRESRAADEWRKETGRKRKGCVGGAHFTRPGIPFSSSWRLGNRRPWQNPSARGHVRQLVQRRWMTWKLATSTKFVLGDGGCRRVTVFPGHHKYKFPSN